MKVRYIFYLMVLIIISSCGSKDIEQPKVQGAWQLYYWKRVAADTIAFEVVGYVTGTDIKVWSGKNFISVGQFKEDTTYQDNYAGGTYKLNGNQYEENILYHVDKKYIGKTIKMILEIQGDTLIQSWPTDQNGQIDKSNYSIEKYVRIK